MIRSRFRALALTLLAAASVAGLSVATVTVAHRLAGSEVAVTAADEPSSSPSPDITDPARFEAAKQRLIEKAENPPPGTLPKPDPSEALAQAKRHARPQTIETGIIEDREAPAPPAGFEATNRWGGIVAGNQMVVYAGRAGYLDPTTGALLIMVFGPDDVHGKRLTVPGEGALRITAENGNTLTIVSAAGKVHTLDLVTLQLS